MKKAEPLILCFFLAAALAGCGESDSDAASAADSSREEQEYLYYLDEDEDEIVKVPYQITELDDDGKIMELIARQSDDAPENMHPVLPDGVTITDYSTDGTTLTLGLEGDVSGVSSSRRTLMAGGLVKTFLQIKDFDKLSLTVNGEDMTDSYGRKTGALSLTDFVENTGRNINNYQSTTMTLYFTDETGTKLIPEVRKVYYSSNEPVEWALVEELISGPEESGHNPILSSDTNVLSVTSQDGICYVNFDDSVENPILSVRADVTIYGITNSLMDTVKTIRQVQFSINGENNVMFRSSVDLSKPFTKENLTKDE